MSSASSIASRGCNGGGGLVDLSGTKNIQQQSTSSTAIEQKRISLVPPLYRSRTDSLITYTPPSIAEAPGSTFYIRKNGQIDYLVLLKVRYSNYLFGRFSFTYHVSSRGQDIWAGFSLRLFPRFDEFFPNEF